MTRNSGISVWLEFQISYEKADAWKVLTSANPYIVITLSIIAWIICASIWNVLLMVMARMTLFLQEINIPLTGLLWLSSITLSTTLLMERGDVGWSSSWLIHLHQTSTQTFRHSSCERQSSPGSPTLGGTVAIYLHWLTSVACALPSIPNATTSSWCNCSSEKSWKDIEQRRQSRPIQSWIWYVQANSTIRQGCSCNCSKPLIANAIPGLIVHILHRCRIARRRSSVSGATLQSLNEDVSIEHIVTIDYLILQVRNSPEEFLKLLNSDSFQDNRALFRSFIQSLRCWDAKNKV